MYSYSLHVLYSPPPTKPPHATFACSHIQIAPQKHSTDDTRPIRPSNTFPAPAGHEIWICPHQQLAPHSLVAEQRGSRHREAL